MKRIQQYKRKVIKTKKSQGQVNKFGQDFQKVQNRDYDFKFSGDTKIPRQIVTSQPLLNGRATFKTQYSFLFQGSLGTNPFNNVTIRTSGYQLVSGGSAAIWPGSSQFSSKYLNIYCVETRAKFTFANTLAFPTLMHVTPKRAPPTDFSVSLLSDYLLPQTKTVALGASTGGQSVKTIYSKVNVSALYGYDITSSSQANHISGFATNPLFPSGHLLIMRSFDGTSSPSVDVNVELELDVIGIFPIDLLV